MARKAQPETASAPLTVDDLRRLSCTELVALAHDLGQFDIHRGMEPASIVNRILNPKRDAGLRSVDRRRLGIMEFVGQNYEQLRPLLACPAINKTPTACFSCSDVQVTHCWATNPDTFRTPNKKETDTIMTAKYEPRTRAQWEAVANSTDMAERSLIAKALMDLGVKAGDLRSLPTPADKVNKIMALQAERGFATEDAKPAAAKKAAAGAKPAAPAAAGAKPATAPAAAAAAPAGNALGRLEERVDDVQTMLTAQGEEIAELKAMLVDAHAMIQTMFVMGGMDEAVFAEMKGKLHDEGNG